MDKFEFMKVVEDIYGECKTEKEIASRMRQMKDCVIGQAWMAMGYLKAGISKNGEKSVYNVLKS